MHKYWIDVSPLIGCVSVLILGLGALRGINIATRFLYVNHAVRVRGNRTGEV